jgi:hypothetical protein
MCVCAAAAVIPMTLCVCACSPVAESKMTACDSTLEKLTSQMADLQSTEECASTVQKMCRASSGAAIPSSAPSALDEGEGTALCMPC